MKYYLIGLLMLLLAAGCNNSQNSITPEQASVLQAEEPPFSCFNKVDTFMANSANTKACHNTAYQMINDRAVLAISYDTPTLYDSCLHVIIDTSDTVQPAQLFLYEEGKANVIAFCNDYGKDGPVRTLKKASGDLYIRFESADTSRETAPHNFKVSIWINYLRFNDKLANGTGSSTTISKILFLNVPNWTWFAG